MNRAWPAYRRMPISLKVLGGVIIVAPLLAIQGERRGLEYDRSQWQGATVRLLDERQLKEEMAWQQMSTRDKIAEWADRHQYSIIIGGWATSLAVAGAIISRNRYQTTAQKVVQARMWAQGLTIGLLIAAGAMTQTKRLQQSKSSQADHSWIDVLHQHEKERLELMKMAAGEQPQTPSPSTQRNPLNA
ncbi:hypothetical protein AMATHDRAFT_63534 [Amanita thiersii Skay4041]|uniref:HIG1 domain-containing protein n=1 Tax=Amanita thiersii Skay4041 TaxID=703135 RepID=A0A2A9NLW8_9AGAR|nr:hypothetical protein AMATHDRAFT_63534 [Amanita thiersii Skay4041]